MQIPLRRHLHQRYLHLTAVIALLIGLAVSAAQGYRDYRQQTQSTRETVEHLLDAARPSAALASYTLDPYLAQRVVDGLTVRSAIYSARLVTDLNDTLAEANAATSEERGTWEYQVLERVLGTSYSVRRPLQGALANQKMIGLGYLEISIAPALDGAAFFERAALGLAAVFLQTVLLCGALTLAYMGTTSRPLRQVVQSLQDMDHSKTGPCSSLPIPDGHDDNEIGYMISAFNNQLLSAHTQIIARQRAEENLRRANEDLEARVAERTSYLNHEITERRAIETALRHSEGRFRDLAEVSSDWFWETDNQGQLIAISERFLQLTDWPAEMLIGKTLQAFVSCRMMRVVDLSLFRLRSLLLITPERLSFELAIKTAKGGEVRAQVAGKRMISATGVLIGYRGTGHDITRQVEDAEKLRLATSEAERANAAKSQFLANMSHELRTPMNAILGFAQLLRLQRQNPLADAQLQYVNHIVDAGEHLLGLINDVLDLARIEAGHLDLSVESFDVLGLLEECVDMLHPLTETKSLTLTLCHDDEQAPIRKVQADRVRLKQVVINLVSNAIKYNVPQGTVTVTVDNIDGANDTQWIKINIADSGIGIPETHLKRIFDPFHRVSAATQAVEGTGVGLAVTRRLLEAMNGEIGVESTLGEGSVFWFTLPCALTIQDHLTHPCRRPALASPDTEAFDLPAVPLSLLYVEDNPANLTLMRDLISTLPQISLTEATTCAEALAAVEQALPDLAFLDINLPDGDGGDLARTLRANPATATLPLIALSANARAQDIDSAHQAGFDDYLCKPFDVQDVVALLRHRQTQLVAERSIVLNGEGI